MVFLLFVVFFIRGCKVSELDYGNTLSIGWVQKHHSTNQSEDTNDKNTKYYALIQPGIILHNHQTNQSSSSSSEGGESKKFSTSNWNIFNKGGNSNKSQTTRLKRDESRYSPTLLGLFFFLHFFLLFFHLNFSFHLFVILVIFLCDFFG